MIPLKTPHSTLRFGRVLGLALVLLLTFAGTSSDPTEPASPHRPTLDEPPPPITSLDPREPLPAEARGWVDEWIARLSVPQQVGQLLMVRTRGEYYPADAHHRRELGEQIRELGLGGVILFRSDPFEAAAHLVDLQSAAVDAGLPPLLASADFEWGAEFRVSGAVPYPTAMALGATGDPAAAEWMGRAAGRDARALGIHWIFAPVADVNVNPRNPVINVRSFGEDPDAVADLAAAFVRGAQASGVLATAKHFPGHGDTAVDSHLDLPVLEVDSQRLQRVELHPFRAAIDAGVASVMTAHMVVPALTAEPDTPATLSPDVLTDLLRHQLGFQGLVVTDALEMGGISRSWWSGEAAVKALKAGADVLLLPPFPDAVHAALVRAVRNGELSPDRLRQAVRRVLEAKARLGLARETVPSPLGSLPSRFAPAADADRALRIAESAVTLVRNRDDVLPLDARDAPRVAVVSISDVDSPAPTGTLVRALRSRLGSVASASVDGRTRGEEVAGIVARASRADVVVLATRVRVRSGVGSISLPPTQLRAARLLTGLDLPVVLVALGSPYAVASFPEADAVVATYGWSEPLQLAAARALAGEIPWRGHLPVTLPGLYPRGHGVEMAALDATLRRAAGDGDPGAVDAERTTPLRPTHLDEAHQALQRAVAEGAFPGATYAVGHRNTLVRSGAVGRMGDDPSAPAMPADAVFDLASLTKVVATTTVAMQAVESGRLRLDYPVRALVPEFSGPGKDRVTVRHLLTHTSGLPAYVEFFRDADPDEAGPEIADEILRRIYTTPLETEPGTRTAYSDLGVILLGEVLDRALGRPFEEVAAQDVFEPLGMDRTLWTPGPEWTGSIPPTEEDPWRGRLVRGEVHDRNAYAMGGVAPHAGLFSSAGDLAIFAQTMLNGGTYAHRRIVESSTIRDWTRRQGITTDSSRALGWDTARPSENWSMLSPSAYGHTGFTGTSLWIDPERELFVVLLSNRVHPSRENRGHVQARIDFHRAVVDAVDRATGR